MLVEDSAGDVRLMREAIKEAQFAGSVNLVVVPDGVEALDYMERVERGEATRPDLILLDLNLPRKNGREVLSEIKSSPAHRHTPVLVMSSSRAVADIQDCYRLNANCYITKPTALDEYFDVVRAIEEFWFNVAKLPTLNAA